MLQLTKRSEYGLAALLRLVEAPRGAFVSAREICDRHPLPRRLVAETLKDLHGAHLVESQRGAGGGYRLARPSRAITLGEIVAALEGKPEVTQCDLVEAWAGSATNVGTHCPVKNPIERLRANIWNVLAGTTLEDLAHGRPLLLQTKSASS
jgi:Rrf2 family protein